MLCVHRLCLTLGTSIWNVTLKSCPYLTTRSFLLFFNTSRTYCCYVGDGLLTLHSLVLLGMSAFFLFVSSECVHQSMSPVAPMVSYLVAEVCGWLCVLCL